MNARESGFISIPSGHRSPARPRAGSAHGRSLFHVNGRACNSGSQAPFVLRDPGG
jgi:hypothetical protein